jgi:hypothetical protein
MKKQITRLSAVQTAKVTALVYAIFSLLYTIIGVFMVLLGSGEFRWIGLAYIFIPIPIIIFGFLFTLLFCAIYNLVAGWVGGIEFELTDE